MLSKIILSLYICTAAAITSKNLRGVETTDASPMIKAGSHATPNMLRRPVNIPAEKERKLEGSTSTTTTVPPTTPASTTTTTDDFFFSASSYQCVIGTETITIDDTKTLSGPWCCKDATCKEPDTDLTEAECEKQIPPIGVADSIAEVIVLGSTDPMDRQYKPCRVSFSVENGKVASRAVRG